MRRAISPTENHLKAKLLNELRRTGRISESTTIANELPVGSTGVRADLAFLNRAFCGVEIKSNRDSLKRLERQLAIYKQYFDRTILLIGSKHLEGLKALQLDMDGVELWVASGLSLRREKQGSTARKDEHQIELLTVEQHRRYSTRLKDRSITEKLFRHAFRDRFQATSQSFWQATLGRVIESEDLVLLSRFEERRQLHALLEKKRNRLRKEWEDGIIQPTHSSSVS